MTNSLYEVTSWKKEATETSSMHIMDKVFSTHEVNSTFGTCSGTPGPDGTSAKLIDMASRHEMTYCLKLIWNKAWSQGIFLPEWKQEHRAVLPKPDKDTYHQCQSYRTVSITSIIGKRFEKMTSTRLSSYLESINFDAKQHAYLQGRSTTHALLSLIERLQKAILNGKVAAVVFFDFTDAFGNVKREKLIEKLWEKFQIRGKLFLHLVASCQKELHI